jgi:class 3 adenylate cyclase
MAEKKPQPEPVRTQAAPAGEAPPRAADPGGDTDIDQLLRAQGEVETALRQQKAQFAVMFTDIVGSTAFFERYGDTAGLMMLQRHHELVLPAIEEASGTVIKTIGDAVMATFSSAEQAVRTAATIQKRLEDHNAEKRPEEQIHTRIGVNFGAGYIKDRDVFGDVVNTAARFVKACRPAQVLASRTVIEQLPKGTEFGSRSLGTVPMHGKSEPEEIFEIIWTAPERYQQLRDALEARAAGGARQVLGRYELMEEIGRGAMGLVYKAYDPAVGRIVALKTVRVDVSGPDRDELIRRLRQEAQAAGRLEHPNIVTIYDAGEIEGLFYLTMQFIKGRTLAELIAERAMLPVEQVILLMDQICDGLHYAHERGIVHRDLKPSNIIITAEGSAKIVDFGIAKVADVGTTKAGMILGTPSYMSPEQARGGRVDRRSDLFSLGAILYELITGEKPFSGNTPTAIIYKILNEEPIPVRVVEPAVHPALDRIVRKALAKNPFERYQDAQEFRQDIKSALAPDTEAAARKAARAKEAKARPGRPVRKTVKMAPVTAPEPAPAAAPRRGLGWAAVIVVVVLAGAGVAAWQLGWLPQKPAEIPPPQVSAPPSAPAKLPETTSPGDSGAAGAAQPAEPSAAKPEKAPEKAEVAPAPAPKREPRREAKREPRREAPAEPVAAPATGSVPERASAKAPATEQQREAARWYRLAEQYAGQGKYDQAVVALESALKIDPSHTQAKDLLARVRAIQQIPR